MAETILHFGAVRLRVNGTGTIKMYLTGLESERIYTVAPLPMSLTTGREPTILTNFNSQRARLRMQTVTLDDYMRVNRVVIFMNAYAEEFPR